MLLMIFQLIETCSVVSPGKCSMCVWKECVSCYCWEKSFRGIIFLTMWFKTSVLISCLFAGSTILERRLKSLAIICLFGVLLLGAYMPKLYISAILSISSLWTVLSWVIFLRLKTICWILIQLLQLSCVWTLHIFSLFLSLCFQI